MLDSENAIIEIISTQKNDNGTDKTEIVLSGSLKHDGNKICIRYIENSFENNFSEVTVSVEKKRLYMERWENGHLSDLIVEPDKRHSSIYNIGIPEFSTEVFLGIYGKYIIIEETDDKIEISATYTVDIDSCFVSENNIKITVKESQPCQN